jgi:hypothetical protein
MRFYSPFVTCLALSAGAALFLSPPVANAQTFNFEGQTETGVFSGGYTTLTETQGGVTFTLVREGGVAFDISNVAGTTGFGSRTLSPFSNETSNTAFIGNFSTSLTGVSVAFGDFGADVDILTLQAFSGLNASGTLLGLASGTLPGTGSAFASNTLTLSGLSGIQSIRFIGGSPNFPNSVYYDNISVTQAVNPVPEPSEWLAMGMAGTSVMGLMVRARRRRAVKSGTTAA